jgi:hypothetical protein
MELLSTADFIFGIKSDFRTLFSHFSIESPKVRFDFYSDIQVGELLVICTYNNFDLKVCEIIYGYSN